MEIIHDLQQPGLLGRVFLAFQLQNLKNSQLKNIPDFLDGLSIDLPLKILHSLLRVALIQQNKRVPLGRQIRLLCEQFLNLVIDFSDDVRAEMHVDVVEADDCIPAYVGGFMGEVGCDCVGEGLDDAFVHDAGDKAKGAAPEVFVVADEVVSQRIAGEEDLLLERLVCWRLGFLDDLPVQQHDLAKLVTFVLVGDDVGDDMHDDGRIALIGRQALDQLLHSRHLVLKIGAGDSGL